MLESVRRGVPTDTKNKWKVAYVCWPSSLEQSHRLRLISVTFHSIDTGQFTIYHRIAFVFAFHEIRIHNEDIEKTAFNTHFVAFEWVVMPFGLCNASSTPQRVANDRV